MRTAAVILTAGVAGIAVTGGLGFAMIPWLKKLEFGQSYFKIKAQSNGKTGVPAMGGLTLVVGVCCAIVLAAATDKIAGGDIAASGSLVPEEMYTKLWSGVMAALAFGLIGFVDDYIKTVKHQNIGLSVKQKTVMQFFVSLAYLCSLYMGMNGAPYMYIPFVGAIETGFFHWISGIIIIYAAVNSVNITDGVDGLCACTAFPAFVSIGVIAALKGLLGFSMVAAAVAGACVGFVLWNRKPAKAFMGNAGSMFLGGMLVALSYAISCPLVLLLVGAAYAVEGASVLLQIIYYKKTGGKKLFQMAPVHRHLKICGRSKKKITAVFTVINIFGGAAAVAVMYYGGYIL